MRQRFPNLVATGKQEAKEKAKTAFFSDDSLLLDVLQATHL